MTPAELAALLGVHSSTVSRWLVGVPYRGRRPNGQAAKGRPPRVYRLEDVVARLEAGTVDNSKYIAQIRAVM